MAWGNFWHPISQPHPDGKSHGVELMDVSGRIYQAPGEVILDGMVAAKPKMPSSEALAWRIKDGG